MDKKALALLFSVVFMDMVGLGFIIPLLPDYVARFGGRPTLVGLLTSTYALGQFFAAPIVGRLSDRFGRKPLLLFSNPPDDDPPQRGPGKRELPNGGIYYGPGHYLDEKIEVVGQGGWPLVYVAPGAVVDAHLLMRQCTNLRVTGGKLRGKGKDYLGQLGTVEQYQHFSVHSAPPMIDSVLHYRINRAKSM